ncbi:MULTISPECIES: MarR family transcriptional regulator [Cohnella]|uniref:MarR family transcriptional regulator n=1 Tax=Cohnella TaxID=329857 RepID=UPI0009BA095F|nr:MULTISPECIES: MarR family transcriptional regulator [Cohnella]MBN2980820.1 MarR family transcriptional regulator [Cohnella algarum]
MDNQVRKQAIDRYKRTMFTVQRRLHSLIKELMPEDLTVDQYFITDYLLTHGKCTSTELAEAFCVGKSSITAIMTRLFDKQLVLRVPDEKDRRVISLLLTEEGRRLAEELGEKVDHLLADYLVSFTDEEADRFLTTYEKLADVLVYRQERG